MVSATTLCAQEVATTSQDEAADLAKKLSNSVASLISVRFQRTLQILFGRHSSDRVVAPLESSIPIIEDSLDLQKSFESQAMPQS
jgi:hypothetical protein